MGPARSTRSQSLRTSPYSKNADKHSEIRETSSLSNHDDQNSERRDSPGNSDELDFSAIDLVCPIDADEIRSRWVDQLNSTLPQDSAHYPATSCPENIVGFLHRVLRVYIKIPERGRGFPPFIHASQLMTTNITKPLASCLKNIRLYETQLTREDKLMLQREMSSLYQPKEAYDDLTHLAAFQAYLIYTLVLHQRGSCLSRYSEVKIAMQNLQDLAISCCRRGLVCIAEQQKSRPTWEAWIVAEAKRRTLYTMYLFDILLVASFGKKVSLNFELKELPAPSSKALWTAKTRHEWEVAYDNNAADWTDGMPTIHDLWPIEMNEVFMVATLRERALRTDRWLMDADEFGTLLYTVNAAIYGA